MAETLTSPETQPAADAGPLPRSMPPLLAAALLFLITFAAYLPALKNGYIWDDDDYVVENHTLRNLEGLRQIWFQPGTTPQYYPLVHTSFWIEYHLWELKPAGYHAVNVVLHAGAAVLLWLVLGRLKVPGAWLAAAIFALHPVQVESVAWITERKNVLSAVFYFASALLYLRMVLNQPERLRPALYAGAFFLYLCALLSKTVTCTLPAALLVILWWKRGRLTWRDVVPLLPFFAVGIGFGLLTAWMERDRVGATGKEWDFTFIERCLIAGRALWFYATKLVLPVKLTFIYPRWTIDQSIGWLYVFPLAALGVMGSLFALRRHMGRGPLAGVLLFSGTLFPALGFFNVYPMRYSFVADHFQYHASASLIALFTAGLVLGARRLASPGVRPAMLGGAGLLLILYGALTWRQTYIYKDYATVWEDTLAKNPDSPIALTSVASVRVAQQRNEEAMALYRRALELAPEDDVANFNLGKLLAEQGQNSEALEYLKASIEVSPECSHCHYFYAAVLSQSGRGEESVGHYEKALSISPSEPFTHYNYAVTLIQLGRADDAIRHYKEAIALQPDLGFAWYGLRDALASQHRAEEGEQFFREGVKKHPQVPEAHIALGDSIMMQQKREKFGDARLAFEEALKLRPGWDEAAGRLQALQSLMR